MGQYFAACSLNKKENIFLGKMMEQSWIGNDNMNIIMELLSNRWKRNKIVWCGDYADDVSPYDFENKSFPLPEKCELENSGFIYNIDKLEMIDMKRYHEMGYTDEDDYLIHPLPILTQSEGGCGGGDYRNLVDPMVGVWSGDRLFTSFRRLSRYTDITLKVYPREITQEFSEADYERLYHIRLNSYIIKNF